MCVVSSLVCCLTSLCIFPGSGFKCATKDADEDDDDLNVDDDDSELFGQIQYPLRRS